MAHGPSSLSLAAAALYALVIAMCSLAAGVGKQRGQVQWHVIGWLLIIVLYVLLASMRIFDLEETFRASLRGVMRGNDVYGERREIQRPMAAAAIVFAAAGVLVWGRTILGIRKTARDWAVLTACSAALVMIILICLRLISLHGIDALLYGAFKLNWVTDIGASLTIAAMAAVYIRRVRRRRS